jgi:flavin-binding protein dodecin
MAGSAPLTTIVEPAANQLPHRRPGVALPAMSDHTYRVIEIVGSSPDGIDAAIRNAVSRASETMRGLDWFEMESVRGHLEDGAVGHFQVTLKVGFRLEDPH